MARRKKPVHIAEPDPNQITMPGVRPVSLAERLQCRADTPMLPRRMQKPMDIGFWDPMRDQLEMF
ncbi:hypothetical protein D6851_02950 [Altericroceibacterium spongiae]|uniref:Uncharacterized protein n=1 Tax=Altericroceibacterium spongiae TaxID=2320269 RepID=A0A420ES35_9SPHN|nr:hypothetical protein [Altericroceibacterium spongiae]RKF23440.1 hypothetical protein D6851_02950 [Altericroceibacterium spongiae]